MGQSYLRSDKVSKSNWSKKLEFILISTLCAGSLGLRLFVIQYHPFVNWDGAYYINYFRSAAWQSVYHPGYSLVIEFFRLVIPDGVRAAQMVSIVAGSVLAFPLFYLARNFMNSLYSFLTVIVVVLNPLLIRYSAVTLTESLFILLEVVSYLFYIKRRPILFGISSGLAYLTRPEAILFFSLIIIYEIIQHRRWQFVIFIIGSFFLLALPYIFYLRIHTGEWTISPKTMNIRVWEKDWHINVSHEASDTPTFTFYDRLDSGFKYYTERLKEYGGHIFRFAGIPLVITGILGILKKRNILLSALPMFFILPLFGLDPNERFITSYIPFLTLFSFIFLSWVNKNWVAVLGAVVIIVGYSSTLSYAAIPDQGITEFCTAGVAMKPMTHVGDIFVDRKPFTAFYAGGDYMPMPNDPVDSILAYCHRVEAKYLVVSARVVRVYRPQLNFLLYSDTVLNRMHLKTAYVAGLDSGYGIRVIKLSD
jgi:hypothetical protein